MNAPGTSRRSLPVLAMLIGLAALLAGCGKKDSASQSVGDGDGKASDDSALGIKEDTKPEERTYLMAAKPFVLSLASRQYGDAYALLATHARARMSLNQFEPAEDDNTAAENERHPSTGVTAARFAELMKKVEGRHGTPRKPRHLSVFSTDPDVLNRRSKEQFGAMDSMFAIGAMPESIPAEIRRASLRGQISTELSAQELEKAAKQEGVTVEQLKKDPDFDPYFNFKIVLVEEDGRLKVGYFEFLPPSMLD